VSKDGLTNNRTGLHLTAPDHTGLHRAVHESNMTTPDHVLH